jgi:hypothetical protein
MVKILKNLHSLSFVSLTCIYKDVIKKRHTVKDHWPYSQTNIGFSSEWAAPDGSKLSLSLIGLHGPTRCFRVQNSKF